MKILIVPICYNSHEDARKLLSSINVANRGDLSINLDVILVDNSTDRSLKIASCSDFNFNYKELKNQNIGYFPSFNMIISDMGPVAYMYDYIIVSNVDLMLAEDFIENLIKYKSSSRIGLLAPGIYSNKTMLDLNPGMLKKPSKNKIKFMIYITSNAKLFEIYNVFSILKSKFISICSIINIRSSKYKSKDNKKIPIYGAHGSIMIFCKEYFLRGGSVNYERFLFGEEGFVAEQLIKIGLLIEHTPNIKVFDNEHGSTSKSNIEFIASEHNKSYKFYLKNFF